MSEHNTEMMRPKFTKANIETTVGMVKVWNSDLMEARSTRESTVITKGTAKASSIKLMGQLSGKGNGKTINLSNDLLYGLCS